MATVLMLGPDPGAVSGVSTHLNQLLGSNLASQFKLVLFQVGSEGRSESRIAKLWRFVASPAQLWFQLRRDKPDIVHINSAMEPKAFWRDLAYLIVARLAGRKVVFQVHGGYLPREFAANNALLQYLLRKVLSMPHKIVLLAEIERLAYREFGPATAIDVVANAIDEREVATEQRHDERPGKPLRLVYVGRLAHVKGVIEAVKAVALLRSEGIPVELSIVGSGPAETDLRRLVTELDLEASVLFKGAVFGESKSKLWLESDVFVFPTYHREGLPYALLESMAAGSVPITCPVGAIPDVMRDREHGLFVRPQDPRGLADALAWLHNHRAEMIGMAGRARQRVLDEYTVKRLAADFEVVYNSL